MLPYMMAIQAIDWRRGLSEKEQREVVKLQFRLPVTILPDLLLGDALCARDVSHLVTIGVTHVLNVAGQKARGPVRAYDEVGIASETIEASDISGYEMLPKHLDAARAFFATARASGGRCLVHCAQGFNRSGALAAAEFMLHTRTDVLSAVAHCRLQRGNQFLSNRSFQAQLIVLARGERLLGSEPPGRTIVESRGPPVSGGNSARGRAAANMPSAERLPSRRALGASPPESASTGHARLLACALA